MPDLAVTVLVPVVVVAVASPELLMVAMVVAEDVQVTDEETSFEVPSPKLPVAVNCCVLLGCMVGFVGEIVNETSVLPLGKNCPQATAMDAARKIIATALTRFQ